MHRLVAVPSLIILSVLSAATVFAAGPTSAEPAARPNILVIVGDDMGYADVGFHGAKDIPTPNLDALAAGGVRFTNGYVTGPYCSPTRAGLLTGRYQQRFGHEFNPSGTQNGLPVSESTLADRLKAAGYRTALVGKWHLGNHPSMQPQQRGFDEFYGFLGGAHSYVEAKGILRGTTPVDSITYTTDDFGNEACSFIERNQEQPWFLYLAFNAVHTPMDATNDRMEKFTGEADMKRRKYDAMMLAMDEAVGKVQAKLKATGQSEKTLVAFFSDNGGPTMNGTTTNGSSNAPLRGSKRTTLEGGVRVPFVLSWPGQLKPAVFESPVVQLDVHATALAAAGVEAKPEWKLDGVNLLPWLTGQKTGSPHDALYWRFGAQMAVRQGDWKLVRYDGNADTNSGKKEPVSSLKLYNLASDIHEDNDLAAAQPEKVKELQELWDKWNQSNIKPLWGAGSEENEGTQNKGNKKNGKNKKKNAASSEE